jgi:hypothetical protein
LTEWYAYDKTSVYSWDKKLQWVDVATFKVVSQCYTKDKNGVYFYDDIIPWADPLTFQADPNIHGVARDKNKSYLWGSLDNR